MTITLNGLDVILGLVLYFVVTGYVMIHIHDSGYDEGLKHGLEVGREDYKRIKEENKVLKIRLGEYRGRRVRR